MASATTSNVYIHVIEDVINKVREEFINNGGPGENVLNELQGLWELKMIQAGAILGPIDRSGAQKGVAGCQITPNPVHDLNVPYEGTEEYETPTADMLFPPTPLQTPMQTPLPGTAQTPLPGTAQTPLPGTAQTPLPGSESGSMYNIPTGGTPITPNEYTYTNENGGAAEIKTGPGRPSPFMVEKLILFLPFLVSQQPPSPWLSQRPSLDVNVAYVEGREEGERAAPNQPATQDFFIPSGKRKRDDIPPQYQAGGYIPQQDGAGDIFSDELKVIFANNLLFGVEAIEVNVDWVVCGKCNPWIPILAAAWVCSGVQVTHGDVQQIFVQTGTLSFRISQLDGPIPDPYDDVLSTPNIYNYQGVVNEDYNIVNTPVPNEMLAATPAPVLNENGDDDDEDEPLNENDDDDLDDGDQGEDLNTSHLVLAQFDKVTRTKSRWKCTLKDGIMHINNKDILFNKATGEFDF
ncbi:transcription factor IIA large subunit family protein [Striga asiatica]|uniref:Transcription factor IIA large subunit family protein n=1 Tax=Striga asiatica TaxID=4170 RepID=A0A5A7QWI4_STRAF|nr:transcription factor IIA large subunit family protein [Striga asiatica]